MIWVDYGILALIAVSLAIGAVRGFTREALGLATWLLALVLAWLFAEPLAGLLVPLIESAPIRRITAYAALFLGGLLIGGLLTAVVVKAVRESAFSSADRTLGAGLGLVRGVLIVALLVLVFGLTPLRQDAWWRNSLLLNKFEVLADGLRHLIPPAWLDTLQPDSQPVPAAATAALGSLSTR